MSFSIHDWNQRLSLRSDLTSQLVHLTRCANDGRGKVGALQILIKMLREEQIEPSGKSGFICGSRPATCLQDIPLYSIAQNLHEEEIKKGGQPTDRSPYLGIGLSFLKPYAYKKGARPVVYEERDVAKSILPPKEHWRIVNLDLSDDKNFVDWTHEREWRCPDAFCFDRKEALVLLPNSQMYRHFIKHCRREAGSSRIDILTDIRGIVCLGATLF